MWDERYSVDNYIYGMEPNKFLEENISGIEGPVLSIAEGEGRNAVFLAYQGLEVFGVDASSVGLQKAQKLAESRNVSITTEVADLNEYDPRENYFGTVVSIFAHLPSSIRKKLYPKIESSLKQGGVLILEAYSEAQLKYNTGGPKDLDMLMSVDKIKREFPNLQPVLLQEIEREVIEGSYHSGRAAVVQFIGRMT